MFNPMAQYATLSIKICGVGDKTHPSNSHFSVAQSQSNIHGTCSGNTGNSGAYGSYNTTFVLTGVADFGFRIVFVTGRGGAGYHSRGPALTRSRGGYFSGNPRPVPVRGPPTLIPWTGPRLLPPIFNGEPSGV